jgi:hypothetical protein
MPNEMPSSDALSEASPTSMQELFSRNPEYMVDKNIDDIVLHMRDLRFRLEATATTPRHARVKDPNAPARASRSKKVVMDFDEVDFENA